MRKLFLKGILPIMILLMLAGFGRYIYIVDGQIDWFRVMLLYGIPYGIPYMVFYVPRWAGISDGIGALALEVVIGALFGFVIAVFSAVKAMVFLLSELFRVLREHYSH